MKRELKFRYWNPLAKTYKMSWRYNLTHDGKILAYDVDMMDYDEPTDPKNSILVIQQYTGLKDRHGEEIYEGDIVRIYNNTRILANNQKECDALHIVEWATDRFDFVLINGEYMQGCGVFSTPNYEVVGNIMENPELLKA